MAKIMFMMLLASGHSGVIELSTHHPKFEGSCSAIGNGKQMLMVLLAGGHSKNCFNEKALQ
jgi:hypothetical protein